MRAPGGSLMPKRLAPRTLIFAGVALAAGVLLAACATSEPPPTPSPTVTPVPTPISTAAPTPTATPTPIPTRTPTPCLSRPKQRNRRPRLRGYRHRRPSLDTPTARHYSRAVLRQNSFDGPHPQPLSTSVERGAPIPSGPGRGSPSPSPISERGCPDEVEDGGEVPIPGVCPMSTR